MQCNHICLPLYTSHASSPRSKVRWTGWEQLNFWVSFKIAQSPRFLSAFTLKCKNGHQRVQLLWGGRRGKVSCLGNQQEHQQSVTQTVTFGETGRLWLNKTLSWHDDDGPQRRPRVTMLWAKAEIRDCPFLFIFHDAQNHVILLMSCDYHLVMADHSDLKKTIPKPKITGILKEYQHVRRLSCSFPSITPENSDALLH